MKDLKTLRRPELRGESLLLRTVRLADRDAAVRSCNDPDTVRFLELLPHPYHDSDFDDWLRATRRAWRRREEIVWSIADPATGGWLGSVSLTFAPDRQAAEVGYHVAPWARRRGVAAAATRLLRDWSFDDLGLERLEVIADAENAASRRVAERLGFTLEGTMRAWTRGRDGARCDHVLYGLLRDDERL
jgi:RimJ/RimL family protein N-acetyltransferase